MFLIFGGSLIRGLSRSLQAFFVAVYRFCDRWIIGEKPIWLKRNDFEGGGVCLGVDGMFP
ncbi:hypothetical protein [Acanthopleuribacter pedis]|uniref:Uncharacterized protein n=1 Tax=Acanthopleuribacter pedis TaxID=442870 RepID=A0A8J7QE27_9BACT|nr:hypothetical protein [Acanthopleuribacter pedis]MBO1317408.1 hypothetical protein [Acanthopleuribacter pedis]